MATDLVEIAVHSLDIAAPVLDRLINGEDDAEDAVEFTEADFEFPEAAELEEWTLETVLGRLGKMASSNKVRILLEPALSGAGGGGDGGGGDSDSDSDGDEAEDDGDGDGDGDEVKPKRLGRVVIEDHKIAYDDMLVLVWYLLKVDRGVKGIVLQECGLKPAHAIALAHAVKQCTALRTLNLDKNKKLRGLGVAALALAVGENPIVESVVLQDCNLRDPKGYIGQHIVANNRQLVRLDLSGNKIGVGECHKLGAALEQNITLKELDLHNNKIGDLGLAHLCQALVCNIVLESLSVGDNDVTYVSGEVLAHALQNNHSLARLEIQRNKLGDKGLVALAAGISTPASIRTLRFNMNGVGNVGIVAFAGVMEFFPQLDQLYLQDNVITDDGVVALSSALASDDTAVRVLNLGRNKFADEGAVGLSDMLRSNASIAELVLEGNNIADAGAVSIAEGLKENETLVRLNLARNGLGSKGAEMLGFVLASEVNTTLKQLELDENPIQDKAATEGWIKRANQRGMTGPSMQELNITTDGTNIASGSLTTFGVKIANSETVTRFSWFMLAVAVVTNWFDVATDIVVVRELFQAAQAGSVSFAWFGFGMAFLVVPTLYIVFFMSAPLTREDNTIGNRLKNSLMSLVQVRVAYEAYQSYLLHETTARFGSIRVVEVAGESAPQALLQINFLVHTLAKSGGDSGVTNAAVVLSASLALFVLGQTFSDLFEKEFIMRSASTELEGLSLFVRLIPCWIFHICQFTFRAMTISIGTTLLNPAISAAALVVSVGARLATWKATGSKRSPLFAVITTFIANSAWDKRNAVLIGFSLSALEGALVVTALWFAPEAAVFDKGFWQTGVNFEKLDPAFFTTVMGVLFGVYGAIFIGYVYRIHEYEDGEYLLSKEADGTLKAASAFNDVVDDIEALRSRLRPNDGPANHDNLDS